MWPRHRLDVGFADLRHGLLACLSVRRPAQVEAEVLTTCGLTASGAITLSVRSGWDLVLMALDWPEGDEVIVSAITHPDMVALIRAHGLHPVPVDLDPDTLVPSTADLERLRSPRTRAVLIAQLFGGRSDLTSVATFTRGHRLLLVEDAAQAFAGPTSVRPNEADVSLYSFGMLKTATAAGGALVVFRDPALRGEVLQRQRAWPLQRRTAYAARLVKVGLLVGLGQPAVFGCFFRLCRAVGADPDRIVNAATRSFASVAEGVDPGLLTRVRRRPCLALVALLHRRLRRFDQVRLADRARLGEELTAALPAGVQHPGNELGGRTHWLYPVLCADPQRLVGELRGRGVDASSATSNLTVVRSGAAVPAQSARMLDSIVYLPAYPELSEPARRALVAGLAAAAEVGRC